jgi:hypothetical protein
MKINIWVTREEVWEINAWLKTPWSETSGKSITFFHDKPAEQMDVVQVSISVAEYQKIIDNNEEIQQNIAEQMGWVQTTTIDPDTDAQLQMLFGD